MALTLNDVYRIAHLARIGLENPEAEGGSAREAEAYLAQLGNILNLIEEMQAVDTSGVEPMAHAQDVMLRLREDVVTEADQREAFQAIAPKVEAGLYLVNKVIE